MAERTDRTFLDSIGELMASQSWRQADLARHLDLDPSFLSKALRGKDYKALSAEQIARIAELAGLPADYFPEVREARIIAAIRRDGSLRDRLYGQL